MSPTTVDEKTQGIDSPLGDLVLHGGKKLTLEVGAAVQTGAVLRRTIGGASSLQLPLHDPDMKFLDSALARERWDAILDGLHFRFLAADVSPPQVTLTLEDRSIAKLREFEGPVKALREGTGKKGDLTRAEFIVARIREILPHAPITCPDLHVKQPIRTAKQGKQAAAAASAERGHGIGDTKGLTVKGTATTKAQLDIGERAIRVAEHLGAPVVAMVAMIATLSVESVMGAISKNYFQMTPETEAASPYSATVIEEAATGFLKGYIGGEGGAIAYAKSHPSDNAHEVAQAVQRSGAGLASNGAANYGPWTKEALEWVEAYLGGEATDSSTTVKEPYVFEIHKNETYWAGIQRLAKEVNWRAFFVGDRFFYIAEPDLFRSKVRLAIKRNAGDRTPDTPGVETVTFSFNTNRPATEVTVLADAKKWGPPPGSVVTLEGYGPASIGSGDAPVKANKKGQKEGVASAVDAKTHVGKGRYLVESIEAPLRDSDVSDLKLVTIKLRKPTAPLPEPAAKTKTVSSTGAAEGDTARAGAANPTVARVLSFCEREALAAPPYVWGGFSPAGYDCSGFVSAALNVGGWLSGRLDTKGLASWGDAGPGEYITVHDNNVGGDPHAEHVIIEVAGRFFQSGGTSGGCGEFHPSASELAGFPTKRHPKGF